MKKRGITPLAIVGVVILVVGTVVFSYLYTNEEGKEEVMLTPEEQETAETLGLTPQEFKEVSTKAEETFKSGITMYNEEALTYFEEDSERYKRYHNFEDLEIKPGSKIIRVRYTFMAPQPYITYLVKDGEVGVLEKNLEPEGLS